MPKNKVDLLQLENQLEYNAAFACFFQRQYQEVT